MKFTRGEREGLGMVKYTRGKRRFRNGEIHEEKEKV